MENGYGTEPGIWVTGQLTIDHERAGGSAARGSKLKHNRRKNHGNGKESVNRIMGQSMVDHGRAQQKKLMILLVCTLFSLMTTLALLRA
jgi:hypothetical protein